MIATNEVINFDSKARFSSEHESLVDSLSYLDWTLQVQLIVQSLGLPMSEIVENEKTALPNGTLASRLGHKNIGEFISSDKKDYGLGIKWSEWVEKASAFRHKKNYGIYADAPSEVNSELRDVIKILGHEPATSAEYHKAKDAVLLKQHRNARIKHEETISEMQDRIEVLIKSSHADRSFLVKEQERTSALGLEIKKIISDSEKQVESLRKEMEYDKNKALGTQRKEIESQMNYQIGVIRSESSEQVKLIQAEMDRVTQLYNDDNYVHRDEYQILIEEIERENKANREHLLKINGLNAELEDALKLIHDRGGQISDFELRVMEYESLVATLRQRIEDLGSPSYGTSYSIESKELVNSLTTKINELEEGLQAYKESYIEIKEENKGLISRIMKLRLSIKNKNKTIKKNNSVIKALKLTISHNKTTINVMGTIIALVSSSALLLAAMINN